VLAGAFLAVSDGADSKQARTPSPVDLAQFAILKDIKAAQVSPDGRDIGCAVAVTDLKANQIRSELWLVPMDSGPARQIALQANAIERIGWSPRGGQLAVLGSAVEGAAKDTPRTCLWIVEGATGSSKRLTSIQRSNHYLAHQGANLCWSPDGVYLAYLAAADRPAPPAGDPIVIDRIQYKTRTALSDNRRTHIWIVETATGKTRQLTQGRFDEHSIDWSPRGDEIVFCSNRAPDPDANLNYDLFTVRVSDGRIDQLTKTAGSEMSPVWSPDGRSVAYTMTRRAVTTIDSVAEDDHVWVLDRKSGAARELTARLDRRCSHVRWGPDGDQVYFLARDHGKSLIYRIAATGGEARPQFTVSGSVTNFSLPTHGGRRACVQSTPTQPAEVWTLGNDAGDRVMRTRFNADAVAKWPLVEPRQVRFMSFDNTPVEGWLMVPPAATAERKVPLILYIHGGPHGMYGYSFSPTFQLLCMRGYAILFLNPRGSNGYGQQFSDGCVNDWGGGDYRDLMTGLEHVLQEHPELDAGRLGVTGGSYGGYMTNWIITQTGRFKAAVSYAGLSNLISFYATSLYQDLIHVEFSGQPWERYDLLWARSPLKHIKRAATPTLILHGEADHDVHITQSEELYTALKVRGVRTVFVRYPREGHGATEPRDLLDQLQRTVAWFDEFLQPQHQPRRD
jgi:dipeptidyl aminopeptidase/acylaminoacyl peptidase